MQVCRLVDGSTLWDDSQWDISQPSAYSHFFAVKKEKMLRIAAELLQV